MKKLAEEIPASGVRECRATDSRYVSSSPPRSWLAQLSTGNRAETYQHQEESSRWSSINRVCSSFRDVVAFTAVLNDTIRPYLAAKGHIERDVAGMHLAWTRSLQMQIALWTKPYMDLAKTSNEW